MLSSLALKFFFLSLDFSIFIRICLMWSSLYLFYLEFVELHRWVNCFSSNLESFKPLFLWIFFYSFLSSSSSNPIIWVYFMCLMVSHASLRFCSFNSLIFFTLFFGLHSFYQSIFKFIDSFFSYQFKSVVESLQWIFRIR